MLARHDDTDEVYSADDLAERGFDAAGTPGRAAGRRGPPRVEVWSAAVVEPVRVAHDDAFATHWGSTAQSLQQGADFMGGRSFRGDVSHVVRDDEGTVLARAVLEATVTAAAGSGRYDWVELGVDSANPGGAGYLYASVGFVLVRTTAAFTKVVEPLST